MTQKDITERMRAFELDQGVSRRGMMKGTVTGLTAVYASMLVQQQAQAQTGTEPRIQLGDDWEIDDFDDGGDTNIRIRHQPSGDDLVFDVSDSQWEMAALQSDEADIGTGTQNVVLTEDIDIEVIPDSATRFFEGRLSNGAGFVRGSQKTTGISTTSKVIYTMVGEASSAQVGGELFVAGRDGSNNRFFDKVLYTGFGSVTVLGSNTRNSPASRTYSMDGQNVELAMGSGTYAVMSTGINLGTNA